MRSDRPFTKPYGVFPVRISHKITANQSASAFMVYALPMRHSSAVYLRKSDGLSIIVITKISLLQHVRRDPKALKEVSRILIKEGLHFANLFYIFQEKLTFTDLRLIYI